MKILPKISISALALWSATANAATSLEKIVAVQQAQIAKLTSDLNEIKTNIENGNIACPQFQIIEKGTDGIWHDLKIKLPSNSAVLLNSHHGYHISADYASSGVHGLGFWTVLNSHSGVTYPIMGGSSTHKHIDQGLELRWAGPDSETPDVYNFKLQIRTKTKALHELDLTPAPIRVCIQPLPRMLNIDQVEAK